MLRITPESMTDGRLQLRVEGRLGGDDITTLEAAVQGALAVSPAVVLELSDLTYVDARGIRLLRGLRDRDVRVTACSGFVAHLLEEQP